MEKATACDNSGQVYRATTLPVTNNNQDLRNSKEPAQSQPETQSKPKKVRRDKSDLGENFKAPDGGWAWLVCIAAGCSNLSIYPCLQQFGFIFRERLGVLGLTSSQITTIINTNPAVSACTGLLNGPMFRRFTFRQVALAGSFFIFTGLMLTAFCESFIGYMITYALLFGFGVGISVSASSLAINTYFKNKRRRAAGFSWTLTGLGPIFLPHVVTLFVGYYGVQGTVFIFAALSLHSMVCALIYQPVRYHAPPPDVPEAAGDSGIAAGETEYLCEYCQIQCKRNGIFSSQYLYQDDDEAMPGYEIIEPGTPMLSRANDGWFGSKLSLTSTHRAGTPRFRTVSSSKDIEGTNRLNRVISEEELKTAEVYKPNNFKRERDEVLLKQSASNGNFRAAPHFAGLHGTTAPLYCTCAEERKLLEKAQLRSSLTNKRLETTAEEDEDAAVSVQSYTFLQKVVTFFDLDLLRDFTFVNLVLGLTIINFGELNFSILTPFILNDFGFTTSQITSAMSVLGGLDIIVRFIVPFVTEKIPWDNRVFFLIGVVGIALGRTVVACTRSYTVILCTFVWIGMCKGVRTIFWPLIIPGCVPLKRLPAASGLALLISGLFTFACGPFVGLIRDRFNYSITLHFLNMLTFIAAISWSLEALVRRYRRRCRDRKRNCVT
uniref:Monocarboxylate transporter 9 n=1 Tax=Zeugodacus cucurbitae TaxID=28588 RepID=A0A0A1WU42_ZEUCU